jgi:hypothetical protein
MQIIKKIFFVFTLALLLNLVWENSHVLLYSAYKGGEITEFILFRASLFDAFVTVLFVTPFIFLKPFKQRNLIIFLTGTCIAILNEWYGLSTGRWEYNSLMPILPIINIGLSPALQLGLLGVVAFKIQELYFSE